MKTNTQLLDELLAQGEIQVERGPLFEAAPSPLPANLAWDRVEGMMLGLAIGDGLGNTTEGMLPGERAALYGEIRDYLPNPHVDNQPVGVPSDDTQLAFWTLEQLLKDGGLDPDHLAERFCTQQIFGIGSAVSQFVANYKRGVRPWIRCGAHSAGNGALMRIAPVLIPHLRSPSGVLWADTALAASVTHNDLTSISACLAWVYILWSLLDIREPPDPLWWPETYVAVARDLEGETDLTPGGHTYESYRGPLWRFAEQYVPQVYREGRSVREACDGWYSAAFLLETVPSVLYILMRHGHDPEEAMVRAVNDTKDNDTVAAIVGSAMGALYGKAGFPERWLAGLSGRTGAHDDGRIAALLAEAHDLFAPSM